MNRADFILSGLTSWAPLSDQPSIARSYRWYLEDWTGLLPSPGAFQDAWGVDLTPWPRALAEQVERAREGPTLVLVSGDPLVATPHEHLLNILRAQGLNCRVRRRPGIVDLVSERLGRRPRLLPASAERAIESHLVQRFDPLLVVEDDQAQDLWALGQGWQRPQWHVTCFADLGRDTAWEGPLLEAPLRQLRCLVFQGALGVSPAP